MVGTRMTKKVKIVADSSADIRELEGIDFSSAPLKIITSEHEYVDDDTLDVALMVEQLAQYKGRSSSSCPNPGDWLAAFEDYDEVYCVTITSGLSGSYNSACAAKKIYESEHPDRHVYVVDSLSTGPEMVLLCEKIVELKNDGVEFDGVCEAIREYAQHTGLLFMLASMNNLANNGRVSPIVAKMAGLLGIRAIGKASDKGELEPLHKVRGEKKALETIMSELEAHGYNGGKLGIAHCLNLPAAEQLAALVREKYPDAEISIRLCGGLCSFYAERSGLLVGYEKN